MPTSDDKSGFLDLKSSASFLRLNWRGLFLALLVSLALVMLGHALLPVLPHLAKIENHGYLALKLGFPLAAALYMIVTYILLIASIVLILPFIRNSKSSLMVLAIAIGLLWFIGYFEAVFLDDTYPDLLVLSLNDSIPAFLLVLLMSRFSRPVQGISGAAESGASRSSRFNFPTIAMVALPVIGVRLIASCLFRMKSRIGDMPIETMSWTILFGVFLGSAYMVYRKLDAGSSRLGKASRFALVFFGINWFMYNLFIPLLLKEPFLDFLIYRAVFDTIAVFAGAALCELSKDRRKVLPL